VAVLLLLLPSRGQMFPFTPAVEVCIPYNALHAAKLRTVIPTFSFRYPGNAIASLIFSSLPYLLRSFSSYVIFISREILLMVQEVGSE
jgi:hypothetical protein